MSFGIKLSNTRKKLGMTQAALAEKVGVSTEAVSKWEQEKYQPDGEKRALLDELLDLPFRDDNGEVREPRIFYEKQMSAFLKGKLVGADYPNALEALTFAKKQHESSDPRKGPAKVPYINHPLTMACHALAMGLTDDVLIAALLLHDVSEDCDVPPEKLPVEPEVQEIVRLVTKPKDRRQYSAESYFGVIEGNPKACMVKCIDRCNNLSSMSTGMFDKEIERYVKETEAHYPKLLELVKAVPEYNCAAWLLEYQIRSLIAMAKRIS